MGSSSAQLDTTTTWIRLHEFRGFVYIHAKQTVISGAAGARDCIDRQSHIEAFPQWCMGQANPCDQNRCFRCRVPFGTPIVAVNARHYRLQAVYSCTRSAVPPCICAVSPIFGDEICRLEEVCAPPLLPDRFERHAVLLGKQLDGVPCGRKEHGQFVKG